jgi:ribosomal protein S18 acetylase RimI-like enzyme
MNGSTQFRPAQPADAGVAAVLLYSAYSHMQATYPLQEEPENRFLKHLEHLFREKGNRFSHQYIQVAQQNAAVVGLVLSFGGRDEVQLNTATGWRLEREAHDDEWYVDALAVLKNWGRKGIGTRLLQMAEQQALQHHYSKIALHVAQGNQQALDLYRHLHYVVTQETFLYHRPYVRMVKTLESGESVL